MNQTIDFDRVRRTEHLNHWVTDCRETLAKSLKFSSIDFDEDVWPLKSRCSSKAPDVRFNAMMHTLDEMHETYALAIRCLAVEEVIADDKKGLSRFFIGWNALVKSGLAARNLIDLGIEDLRKFEAYTIEKCISGMSAEYGIGYLDRLSQHVARLSRLGIIRPISWQLHHDSRNVLRKLHGKRHQNRKHEKGSILDRKIEALNDALSAMFRGDERLSHADKAVLAMTGVMMCAPSRVNEPLCMAIDSVFTLEDYATRPAGVESATDIGRVHMLLLQKGSKGAGWSAKPALNFMIGLLKLCMKILVECGARSRKLVEWYELNPSRLYLPPKLEHLRGLPLTRQEIWQIVNLTDKVPSRAEITSTRPLMEILNSDEKIRVISNTKLRCDGTANSRKTIQSVEWHDLENLLLKRVWQALEKCRHVTSNVHYQGPLSKMLVLFDSSTTPYLPGSLKYSYLRLRLKHTAWYVQYSEKRDRKDPLTQNTVEKTIFQKLGLTMVVNGNVEYAYIESHDLRRWLTTTAMKAKERLSDVLLNKWANRLSIEHLLAYDYRSDTKKADQSAMPEPVELTDVTAGLQKVAGLESAFGLRTDIVTVYDANISMTSMDAIATATQDRPVARSSNQIIILYPTRFGACVHQHHETPCRAFICLPCNENLAIKGHLPTNEQIRKQNDLLFLSIVAQVERLVIALNRGIPDLPESLEAHLVTLVKEGLDVKQMANELINQFQEIKDRIKSPLLKNRLEEAFVARGIVQRLDSPDVPSGALIRYHNPGRHASPGHERALDAHGGREHLDARLKSFHKEYPVFRPTKLGLKDERELLEQEDDNDDE